MEIYVDVQPGGCVPTGTTVVKQIDHSEWGKVIGGCPSHALVQWSQGCTETIRWDQLAEVRS